FLLVRFVVGDLQTVRDNAAGPLYEYELKFELESMLMMTEVDAMDVPPAKQARSRATRDALVRAGRNLCEIKDFDELSVAEIAAEAGCSVGSFYSRFSDKDGFF